MTAFAVFFNNGKDFSSPMFFVISLLFIWTSVLAAVLSFSVGKWLPTAGAFARFLLLGFFTLSVLIFAAKHGAHGLGSGGFRPSQAGFVGLVAVLLFNYVGFELPSSAGEEMKDPPRRPVRDRAELGRQLPALRRAGHGNPAGPAARPGDQLRRVRRCHPDGLHGVRRSRHRRRPVLTGAGAVLGDAAALTFVVCLLTSGVTWIMGSDRALAVSGYDGAAPRFLGVINERWGTPVRVNIFSGIVATFVLVLAHQLTGGNAAKFFGAVLGVTISTTLISYLLIYPALWKLRRSHPDVPRPYRMPAYRIWTTVLMVLLAVTVVEIMAPGAGSAWFGVRLRAVRLDALRAILLLRDRDDPGAGVRRHRRAVLHHRGEDAARGRSPEG